MGDRDAGPTPEAAAGALLGSSLGGFELTLLLGTGGMAEVYRGFDPQLNRYVAVKVLPSRVAQDPEYIARFRGEAQRAALLNHPNVVPVFHFGEEHGRVYLVMPLLKESLRERMDRSHTMDPIEAVALTVEVASALDVAHRHGLVHRDVKPENILLNEDGRPLLSDFGIAREVAVLRDPNTVRTLGHLGLPVGTPMYMAPEQIRGAAADQRVDVYGLGTVLYEMLTGRVPHDGGTALEVVAHTLTEAPRSPTDYNPAIWPELANVVLSAVASDPDHRYPDMSSLTEALREALLTHSPSAHNPSAHNPSASASRPSGVPLVGALAAAHLDLFPPGVTRPSAWSSTEPGPAGTAGTAGTGHRSWGPVGYPHTPHWGDGAPPYLRRRERGWMRTRALAAVIAVIILALGAAGAGGILLTQHAGAPGLIAGPSALDIGAGTPTATTLVSPAPGGTAVSTPAVPHHVGGGNPTATAAATAVPTAVPTAATTAVPTATPLLTPTIVVSSSPLNFQLSSDGKNCVAKQQLTNISAVDAQWTWTNAPTANWQYNTSGPTYSYSSFPAHGTIPPNSSVYVYLKVGPDTGTGGAYCTKLSTTATISVTGGNGTQFSVTY